MILFYILKYNFEIKVYEYNPVLISGLFLLLLAPAICNKTRSYQITAYWVLIISASIVSFFIYTAGGIHAPGAFWISIYPFVGGLLLGVRGAKVGTAMTLSSLAIYYVLEKMNLIPNLVFKEIPYEKQRIVNLFAFIIYSIFTKLFFIRNEEDSQEKLNQQNKEIGNLLRVIIHDISTPLTIIELQLRKIGRLFNNEIVESTLDKTKKSLKSIDALLNHARQITAIKDGKLTLDLNPTSVNQTLKNTIELQQIRADEKNIKLILELPTNECWILADAVTFQNIILNNLITNAIKFTPLDKCIKIIVEDNNNSIKISIKDEGIGIPPSLVGHLFEFNYNTNRIGTKGETGTGYGMPLVKAFVEKMNGTIEVRSMESTPDRPSGTTFTLHFKKHIKEITINESYKEAA